jgi:membrane associated rhomboid family serine protease
MSVEPAPARRGAFARLGPAGPPLLLLAVMWVLETVDVVLRGWLDNGGIQARESAGLLGILFAPLLHGGYSHLLSNTIPLLLLGTLVAASGRGVFWKVTGVVVLLGGFGTWLIAPANTVTIGASGLVFGYLGYLLVAGIRTRHWRDLLVGVAVLVVYGTLLLGALPWAVAANISWQAHLTGAIAGGLAAWWLAPRRAPAATRP